MTVFLRVSKITRVKKVGSTNSGRCYVNNIKKKAIVLPSVYCIQILDMSNKLNICLNIYLIFTVVLCLPDSFLEEKYYV